MRELSDERQQTFEEIKAEATEPQRSYRDDVGNEVNGAIRPSLVDPHGHHLQDSLLKL